ncbi:reverse transcriptase domain-containing protein [Bradyrhizobium sp. RT11b]|uniref:reverse transcriptase domain-containing protein n=1 Tax=Bradyrhizobium sp. RT11b TaxID=3156332 RepID=UPI003390CE97
MPPSRFPPSPTLGDSSPQGAGISPLLTNIFFLHYILDLWTKQWRRRRARGRVMIVRYADSFVMGFESKADAWEMLLTLKGRLGSFGRMLHEGKTRLMSSLRPSRVSGGASGEPRPSPSSASPTTACGPRTAGLS